MGVLAHSHAMRPQRVAGEVPEDLVASDRKVRVRVYKYGDAFARADKDKETRGVRADWWRAAVDAMIARPDIMSIATPRVTVHGEAAPNSSPHGDAALPSNQFPLRFAVVVPGEDGQPVRWTLHQGADPCMTEGAVRERVEKQVRPRMVVRLNRATVPAIQATKRVAVHYGSRCERVFYVHELHADSIRAYGQRARSRAELGAVAAIVADLFVDLVTEMRHHRAHKAKRAKSKNPHGGVARAQPPMAEATVYVHCHGGIERSRFVLLALHALFFVSAAIAEAPEVAVAPAPALVAWSHRQAQFQAHGLSVVQLLTDENVLLYRALTHCLATLVGARPDTLHEALTTTELRPADAALARYARCHAGSACLCSGAPQRPAWLCLRCHDAFFCSLDCVAASDHECNRAATPMGVTCTALYERDSAPTGSLSLGAVI
jgi:hypothetical protein